MDRKIVPKKETRKLLDKMSEYLVSKGLKSTKQRDLIATVIFESKGHLDAEALYQAARKQDPKVGHSTVYRTLRVLRDSGMVSERHFGDGPARYEVSREGEHHDHLICVKCGKIVEFENEEIERLQEAVAAKQKFVILHHRHEMYGHCAGCSK